MKPEWILVANAAEARLLQHEAGTPFTVLHSFHHPASRQRSRELGDAEGGRETSDRSHAAVAFQPRLDPHRKEHLRFARELAGFVEQGAREGQFQRLHVYAASPFLGELKGELGAATQRLLAGSHDLDLSALGLGEIERRVLQARS
mgnify:CR=1 FL=1